MFRPSNLTCTSSWNSWQKRFQTTHLKSLPCQISRAGEQAAPCLWKWLVSTLVPPPGLYQPRGADARSMPFTEFWMSVTNVGALGGGILSFCKPECTAAGWTGLTVKKLLFQGNLCAIRLNSFSSPFRNLTWSKCLLKEQQHAEWMNGWEVLVLTEWLHHICWLCFPRSCF